MMRSPRTMPTAAAGMRKALICEETKAVISSASKPPLRSPDTGVEKRKENRRRTEMMRPARLPVRRTSHSPRSLVRETRAV
jgi:hypothetical protein